MLKCVKPVQTDFSDNKELFRQIAAGNELAFRYLFDNYNERLFFFILRLVEAPAVAEDLVHDVFLRVWVSRQSLAGVDNPDAYLFTIARNRCLDHFKKRSEEWEMQAQLQKNQANTTNDTEERIEMNEGRQRVEQAVGRLPKQQQLVFRLSRQDGLSRDQIASHLNISSHTVKNHLREALKTLRGFLSSF